MVTALKKLFFISRPVSWPNTAFPFGAAYIMSGGQVDVSFVVGILFFLGPYNLLMYGINDVFDYESDILNPRKGGIEGMREQKAFHPTIVRGAIISTLPFFVYFMIVGNFVSNIILLAVLFFVVAYSAAHLRFKERALLDSATSSLHFVGPAIFALSLLHFTADAWWYIVAFFLWGMASHAFGAVQDILPDRKGGIESIATLFGAAATVRFAATLYLLAVIMLLMRPWPVSIVGAAGLLYIANIVKYWNISETSSPTINVAWRRFIWLNFFTGFVVTVVMIVLSIRQ